MTRLVFLICLPLSLLAAVSTGAPIDAITLNAFADRFNEYVALLQSNVVDLKLWQRVVTRWNKLA
jgi:hypothetical protein